MEAGATISAWRSLMDTPWTRRMCLVGAGVGTLAAAGLPSLQLGIPQARSAGERTKFVAMWTANRH